MIVSLDTLNAQLGFTTGDDDTRDASLTALLAHVETTFLSACNRRHRPFAVSSETPVTVHTDGTGSTVLLAPGPVAALGGVTLGPDPDAPTETLAAADLSWRVGSALIRRKDGGHFGALDAVDVVHLTYTPAEEDTADAQLAILRCAAALFYQRGAEDVRAESEGGVRSEFAPAFEDPSWTNAVDAHREPWIG